MEAISNIEIAANGKSLEAISDDFILRHALTWNVMIIGEAANKLTREFCQAHPDTDWRGVTGMRNVLVHDYYQIDVNELWSVISFDIPELKNHIEQYLNEIG